MIAGRRVPAPLRGPCRWRSTRWSAAFLAAAVGAWPPAGGAAAQADSVAFALDELVVVADGAATVLKESVVPVTVLTGPRLDGAGARVLADVLRQVPGLIFLERDGSGEVPLAIARGFYGGGETEYLLVLLDGVPLNDLRTGSVDWTRVRPSEVTRVEVLRGGGSAVHGDRAVGAVVQIMTRNRTGSRGWSGLAAGGGWGDLEASGRAYGQVGAGAARARATLTRSSGYRAHSNATLTSLGASYVLGESGQREIALDARYAHNTQQDPGPLRAPDLHRDRRQANPLFADDDRRRSTLETGATGSAELSAGGRVSGRARVQLVDQEQTRTLLLTPSVGDTQLHDEGSVTLASAGAYERTLGPWTVRAGTEVGWGTYHSRYRDSGGSLDTRSQGSGSRSEGALTATAEWSPVRRLRAVLTTRFDHIRVRGEDPGHESTFRQVSPRVGANVAYLEAAAHAGHVYLSWGRSFKAPTLDQLYDERQVAVGPGTTINLSNPDLRPQRSSDWELGLYQTLPLGAGASADLTVAAYRIDLEDEIDFDLATFRYGNIQQSRHEGVEASVVVPLSGALTLAHTLTLNRAVFASEEFAGNQLKNVPIRAAHTSLRAILGSVATVTAAWRHTGRMYLDDANREPVSPRDVLDLSAEVSVGGIRVFGAARNLLDAGGVEGGFLLFDPATQTSERLLYASGGRHLRLGVRLER